MPELPEVETIRRGLEPQLVGRRIASVDLRDSRVFQVKASWLVRKLCGQSVLSLTRRGKYLVLGLERDDLIFHFGMTGQLTFRDPGRPDSERFQRHPVTGLQRALQHAPDRHTHLQIHLEEEGVVMFRDIRMFGKVFLLERTAESLSQFFRRLGPEPFTDDYSLQTFLQGMGSRKLAIKPLLLDQRFVAGLGNIYADEALYEAGVHPARRVPKLLLREKKKLFRAIPLVLKLGIDHGGTSFSDYVNSDGEKGTNQERLRVYGREGQGCRRCGELIERVVIGQRGTRFCRGCQT